MKKRGKKQPTVSFTTNENCGWVWLNRREEEERTAAGRRRKVRGFSAGRRKARARKRRGR